MSDQTQTTAFCPLCVSETTFQHDHKPDNTGIDDGPEMATRKKPAPKPTEKTAAIRAQAWETRRVKYGVHGNAKYGVRANAQ